MDGKLPANPALGLGRYRRRRDETQTSDSAPEVRRSHHLAAVIRWLCWRHGFVHLDEAHPASKIRCLLIATQ